MSLVLHTADMPWRWPHFRDVTRGGKDQLSCSHCGVLMLDEDLMDDAELLRERAGFPLLVSSGYRCAVHNAAVSTTGVDGPHTRGAIDFVVSGGRAFALLKIAYQMDFTGIGTHQRGPHEKRFVHVDKLPNGPGCPRPTPWTY